MTAASASHPRRPLPSRARQYIQDEIDANEKNIVKLSNKTKTRLQNDKVEIARAYGAAELGECLMGVFRDPFYALSTFNMDVIKERWGDIMGNDSKAPKYLGPEGERGTEDIGDRIRAIETIFRVFSRDRLFLSSLPTSVVLGELEMCLNNEELPSGGLTFDSQHAVMLRNSRRITPAFLVNSRIAWRSSSTRAAGRHGRRARLPESERWPAGPGDKPCAPSPPPPSSHAPCWCG